MNNANKANKIQLIDVTLRDGGYKNNFNFTKYQVSRILENLERAGIDYIELGYKNGTRYNIDNIGIAGICDRDYLKFCSNYLNKSKVSIMVHPENIYEQDISELKEAGVSLVRVCVNKNNIDLAIKIIEIIRNYGLDASANITRISLYNLEQLDHSIKKILAINPTILYFADTNGAMHPDAIGKLFAYLQSEYSQTIDLGFHAHDNIGLAMANVDRACNNDVKWLDASLYGLGKGIGNVKMEFLVAYLLSLGDTKYNLEPIIRASNYIRKEFFSENLDLSIDDFNQGIFNLEFNQLKNNKSLES